MRKIAIWAALLVGVAHSGAQAPLSVDPSFEAPFDPEYGVENGFIGDIHRLDNGHLVVSGQFRFLGDLTWKSLAVLDENGALITPNFSYSGGGGGEITPWNGQLYVRNTGFIRRFDLDGTWDSTFNMDQNNAFLNILQPAEYFVEPDGSILYVGAHQIFDPGVYPTGIYGLIKLTNTGLFDTTFQHRLSDGNIYRIRPTGDGRFWCSGILSHYDGQSVSRLFRIWPNGDLDTTFNTPIVAGFMNDLHQLPDDKLLIGGSFVLSNASDTLYLIRLMSDGNLDTSFHNDRHLEWWDPDLMALGPGVYDILPLNEGQFIVGGVFWTIDGERRGAIAVVDTAGDLVDDLANYYGCDSVSGGVNNDRAYGSVGKIALLEDGMLYIGGTYTGFNDGTWYPGQRMITRLQPMNVSIAEPQAAGNTLVLWPDPGSAELNIRCAAQLLDSHITIRDLQGRVVCYLALSGSEVTVNTALWTRGLYFVELLEPEKPTLNAKWIKQ
ncbi:MAG: hypothetical protein ABI599_03620 [Flavobacteriales bacterium]